MINMKFCGNSALAKERGWRLLEWGVPALPFAAVTSS